MKVKAKYTGECQICGRRQKLPRGKLSLHGYSVMWGCFQGICIGSKELPFEQSCELVRKGIEMAEIRKQELIQDIAELEKPATVAKAWHHDYDSRLSAYIWKEVDIYLNARGYATFDVERDGKRLPHNCAGLPYTNDVLKFANALNMKKAEYLRDFDLKKVEQYIHWQHWRISNWKVKPLKPISKGAENV